MKEIASVTGLVDLPGFTGVEEMSPGITQAILHSITAYCQLVESGNSGLEFNEEDLGEMSFNVKDGILRSVDARADMDPKMGKLAVIMEYALYTCSMFSRMPNDDGEHALYLCVSILSGDVLERVKQGKLSFPEPDPYPHIH